MTCKSCNSPISAGPTTYYTEVHKEVVQNHQQIFQQLCHAVGLQTEASWVVPAVDQEVSVVLRDITRLVLGAYLYNPQYGYFNIVSWNPENNTVGLRNEGVTGTQAAGTTVPKGVAFIVAPRPCCEDDATTILPFLAEDFTAPTTGIDKVIKLTSTFGIQVGDFVRISTGVYYVKEVSTVGFITIENFGDGIAPGIEVEALDSGGNYQYLVVKDIPNPCVNGNENPVGKLIVCDGELQVTLSNGTEGEVPVVSSTDNSVRFKLLDVDLAAYMVVTADKSVSNGATSVTGLLVADSQSGIAVGDLVGLSGTYSSLRFVVTSYSGGVLALERAAGTSGAFTAGTITAGTRVTRLSMREYDRLANPTVTLLQAAGTANSHALGAANTYFPGHLRKLVQASNGSLRKGLRMTVFPPATNTNSVNFNFLSDLYPIMLPSATGALKNLIGGELPAGVPYTVVSDGNYQLILTEYSPADKTANVTTLTHFLPGVVISAAQTIFSVNNKGNEIEINLLITGATIVAPAASALVVDIGLLVGVTNLMAPGQSFRIFGTYVDGSTTTQCLAVYNGVDSIAIFRLGSVGNFTLGAGQTIALSGRVKR